MLFLLKYQKEKTMTNNGFSGAKKICTSLYIRYEHEHKYGM